jgi:hypothetical protein
VKAFSDFLNRLISEKGQGALADEVKIDGAALCRFRSGQGNAPISVIDAALEIGQAVIISRQELKKLEDALDTVSDLWKAERRRK